MPSADDNNSPPKLQKKFIPTKKTFEWLQSHFEYRTNDAELQEYEETTVGPRQNGFEVRRVACLS